MSYRSGSWKTRISLVLALALMSLIFSAPAAAQNDSDLLIMQLRASFTVSDPPEAPFQAHQSMLLFVPGAEAPLHYHGGPGYITILQGELTLFEDGEENVYQAGDSLVETTDKLYRGGNYTDEDTVLMVTYLIPEGEDVTTVVDDPEAPEPPEISPEPLAETVHEFPDSPESFELIHTTASIGAGSETGTVAGDGDTLLTAVTGELDVTIDGETNTLSAGSAIVIDAEQEYSLQNAGAEEVLVMSTELAPDVYSVIPAAGSTVDRTFAMWLIVMTASALFVVGAVLRLTVVRYR